MKTRRKYKNKNSGTDRRAVMVTIVDHDPILEPARRQWLNNFRQRGGVGIGDRAASEMLHAIGRFINECERKTKAPRFYTLTPGESRQLADVPDILPDGEYSVNEAAAWLGYSVHAVRRWIRAGKFPGAYRVDRGNRRGYWIPGSAILNYKREGNK